MERPGQKSSALASTTAIPAGRCSRRAPDKHASGTAIEGTRLNAPTPKGHSRRLRDPHAACAPLPVTLLAPAVVISAGARVEAAPHQRLQVKPAAATARIGHQRDRASKWFSCLAETARRLQGDCAPAALFEPRLAQATNAVRFAPSSRPARLIPTDPPIELEIDLPPPAPAPF
ncbi:MAG: hypothetical protein CMJ18_08070 [Phycisphaeraceae bacterium]|nr:hypothetical protein [Phycisphaeraceae bacterium]